MPAHSEWAPLSSFIGCLGTNVAPFHTHVVTADTQVELGDEWGGSVRS
jgi:hypothetical protein